MRLIGRPSLRHVGVWVLAAASMMAFGRTAQACPFCSAVSQTLRQEMATMDAVVIAEAIAGTQRDEDTGEVPLRVVQVLKGDAYIQPGTTVRTVYYGSVEPGRRFMLSGVEPEQLMWSSPLPVDEREERYIGEVLRLADEPLERLRFFQKYLQDESTMLARDAYDEFAITPYPVIQQLKDEMNHDQLVAWIQDPEMPADRRRLYLVMLGVCGDKSDVPMLEAMLRSTQPTARVGLDSLIACYLTLGGSDGLKVVNELFLENKQAPYADTYAAIMAIRFHGTETEVIPRSDLVESLHHVLDRPDLADLVIPDLARWGDWTQIDRLVSLFKEAEADNNWLRVPVINYMRACPLPEAKQALETLKEIDPEAFKRANTFYTAPVPPPETGKAPETSAVPSDEAATVAQVSGAAALRGAPASSVTVPRPGAGPLADASGSVAMGVAPGAVVAAAGVNPFRAVSVLVTAAATLMILAYLVISGGPQPRLVPVRARAGR